jgi:predicted nucleotide-binding protein
MVAEEKEKGQISSLNHKLEELKDLVKKNIYLNRSKYIYYFGRWYSQTLYILAGMYGEKSKEITRFEKAGKLPSGKATEAQWAQYRRESMLRTAAEIEAILSVPRKPGKPRKIPQPATTAKAFVAHGGRTEALDKVQTFVSAFGIMPLIVEDEPSRGLSVDEHITQCLEKADCAIILGTADDNNLRDGKLYPRRNVCIEIGRVQERFPSRIIYLLEEGASFPSNIAEKVYERFAQNNLEKAFLKIVRELRVFGIVKAAAIRK